MSMVATREAKYLYCIIKCSEERGFNGVQAIGDGVSVHTVVYKDLACVVSDSSAKPYDHSRANMMAHETVIEEVMREFTVLPIRFGTVTRKDVGAPVEEITCKLLKGRYQEFVALLQEMEDKVELGLKALWREEQAVLQEIVAGNEDIRKRRDSIQHLSPAGSHFERMRLGEMVKRALESKREREAKSFLAPLLPLAERVRRNKIVMDRMVLNAAFLVAKEREGAFDQMVTQLDAALGERLVIKYTGPNPPFNFCEVVVAWEER